jgi:polysaccharide biosynthesis protein PslH
MKILWLSRWDSRNPTDGQLLYSEGLISSLERLGADIKVIATSRSDSGATLPDSTRVIVNPAIWPRGFSLLTNISSDAFKQRSADFIHALKLSLDSAPDVVVFDYYATGWALPIVQSHCRRIGRPGPLLVYLSHNHEASLRPKVAEGYQGSFVKTWAIRHDSKKVASMENVLAAACDIICAITDQDSSQYKTDFPKKSHLTLLPGYSGSTRDAGQISDLTPRRVIMMGSLLWIAKQESMRRFIAAASRSFEEARVELVIIGRAEPDFLRSIEAISPCVTALGFVDDPLPLLYSSRIGLMPDELGGGFKLRLMDYVFNGVPVAAIRSQTKGLPLDSDADMITADDSTLLAKKIIEKIDDIVFLNKISEQAKDKCMGKFDWESRGTLFLREIEMQSKVII